MRLHSINQENRTAVIDYMGNLVEVSWIYWEGELLLSDYTLVLIERESISYSDTINLIRNHLASAPKHNKGADHIKDIHETLLITSKHELETPDPKANVKQYSAYKIDVSDLQEADIYEIHNRFKIDDPSGCIQHASKKLLLAGKRTGGKPKHKDIQEAIDTLNRWLEIN